MHAVGWDSSCATCKQRFSEESWRSMQASMHDRTSSVFLSPTFRVLVDGREARISSALVPWGASRLVRFLPRPLSLSWHIAVVCLYRVVAPVSHTAEDQDIK